MFRLLAAAVLLVGTAACGHDHGPPRVKKLPHQDTSPPLRGGGPPRSPRIVHYKIDARFDAPRHQIVASETLTWTNPGQTAVDTLPFHLYLNAFKNDQSTFMTESHGEMRGVRASDTGWGWIQIESLQIAGKELAGKLRYPHLPDETVAELPLDTPVAPGDHVDVTFQFTAQLPEVFARTGYKGDFNLIAQWFPKIGVRTGPPGGEQWACEPFHATTEFFSDFGVYDVSLTVPRTEVVAATGVLVKASDSGDTRTLVYRAEDVHDFVWMADPYMTMISGQAKVEDGTVDVRVYARPEQAEFARRHRDAAIGALERFSADFLPYPWPVLTVIDPPLDAAEAAGGMEYPTFVTTEGDSVWTRPGVRIPEFVTVHEVGHNWFQGMLASNEPEEAWLDEGVNSWADAHAMTDLYGPRHGLDWMGWQADLADLQAALRVDRDPPSPIATAAYAFVDNVAYSEQTYIATQRALATLEQLVGPSKMMAAMRDYARAWAFKHPTGRDLFDSLEHSLGMDLSWFFAPVFEQVGGMKLSVRSASCRPQHAVRGVTGDPAATKTSTETEAPDTGSWVCEVVVQNTGVVHVPVDVELRFADGSADRKRWDDHGHGDWERFVVERSSPLVEVKLDPDGKLLLDSPLHHDFRLQGDGAASLRAASRVASWAQMLMQVVGP